MKSVKSFNFSDTVIVLLIASLAFGNIGGLFEVFRVMVVFLLPLFLERLRGCGPLMKPYFTFFAVLVGYSVLSLFWVPIGNEAPRHALYIVIHFLLFFELIVFSRSARNPVSSISLGWTLAVVMTLVVAVWELTTDEHLSMSKQTSDMVMNTGYELINRQFASVTFYNYNTYVTFLCFAMPFLFCSLMSKGGFVRKVIVMVAMVLSVVCILYNASRGGLLSVVAMSFVYFLTSAKNKRNVLFMSILGVLIFFVFYNYSDTLFLAIGARSADGNLLDGGMRYLIWGYAWEVVQNYGFMGTGIGGIVPAMSSLWNGIVVPHNLLLEALVEFGIIIFIPLVLYMVHLFLEAKNLQDRQVKFTVFISLAAFPFYSIIDSAYLKDPFAFAAFASLTAIVMAVESNIKSKERVVSYIR